MKHAHRYLKRSGEAPALAMLASLLLVACGADESSEGAVPPTAKQNGVEVIGTVQGNIGAQTGEWLAIKMGTGPEAAVTANYFAPLANMMSYTIQAHGEQRFAVGNSVSIELSYMGDQLVSGEATYFPGEGLFPHYTSDGESLTVEIGSLKSVGELLEIEGTAQGELFHVSSLTSGVDTGDAIPIEISFRARLYPQSP